MESSNKYTTYLQEAAEKSEEIRSGKERKEWGGRDK